MSSAIDRVREADRAALASQAAFAAGKFDDYWQREGDAATKRLEALYGQSPDAHDPGNPVEPGAGDSGSGTGGESSGT